MRHLLPFLTFFLVVNLTGCASNYRDELQKDLDLYNNDILDQLEMGVISLSFAEDQIEEEWEEKRALLAEHNSPAATKIKCFLGWFLLDAKVWNGRC